jgi:hypothetical protein
MWSVTVKVTALGWKRPEKWIKAGKQISMKNIEVIRGNIWWS